MSSTYAEAALERASTNNKIRDIQTELETLHDRALVTPLDAGEQEHADRLDRQLAKLIDRKTELDNEFKADLLDRFQNGELEHNLSLPFTAPVREERADDGLPPYIRAGREAGLRTIERYRKELTPEAGDRLDNLLRKQDPQGIGSRYVAAVGNPAYFTAFAKMLADPMSGHLRFSPAEVEAVRAVSRVEEERTALGTGTGSLGGFAVPFTVDPTLMISGTGVLNPLRQISRVETTVGNAWHGISADQVVATYQAEGAETVEASPTLVQPAVTPIRGAAFVPYSIEIEQDWVGLANELARLLSDARDNLDATKMLLGSGTNEPVGILTIGTTGALTTSQRVQTATTATFAVGDPWLLKAGLAPRFMNSVSVIANPGIFDSIYRFTGGNAVEPPIIPTRDGPCFGRPKYELSTMVTTTTTSSKIMLAGDFSNFLIADRLGFSMELVPHLFGGTNRFPTGQRGALAIWRTGCGVLVPNAFRYLEVK